MHIALSIIVVLLMFPPVAMGQSPSRLAFLLINSRYMQVPPLAVNAAALEELKSALSAAKFEVREERDLTQAAWTKELDGLLLSRLRPGDTLLFYYFGYAIQASGDNYLIPVDFDPKSTGDTPFRAKSLTGLIQTLDDKKVGLKMILIDATSQVPAVMRSAGASGSGLGDPDFSDTRQIAYLSSAAKNALPMAFSDAETALFANSVAALIRKPGTTLLDLLTGTQTAVAAANPKLIPHYTTHAAPPFRFTEPPPPPKPPPVKVADEFIGKPQVNRRDRQAYVYIPPGKFMMGCVPGDDKCEDHEKPQHEVTITNAFWMGETEVQVEAYKRFIETGTPKRKMPAAPLDRKGWDQTNLPMASMPPGDAASFCIWAGGRLPTEAEWEYAARAGKTNEIVPLNAENARDKANFSGKRGNDRFDFVAPVRQFDQNAFGLFDLFGNLWELTSDFYGKTYFSESPKEDPKGPATGKEWVSRGGSWDSDPKAHLRISFRNKGRGGEIVGFRCLLPDSEETRKLLQRD